jgi:anti-sigma B factor antagonist
MTPVGGGSDMRVRRIDDATSVVEVRGEITAASEKALLHAYSEASGAKTRAVILDFGGLEYMNGGIGLLVMLLVRADRQKQRLVAFGLNEHHRQLFEHARLDEAIRIFSDERSAVVGAKASP